MKKYLDKQEKEKAKNDLVAEIWSVKKRLKPLLSPELYEKFVNVVGDMKSFDVGSLPDDDIIKVKKIEAGASDKSQYLTVEQISKEMEAFPYPANAFDIAPVKDVNLEMFKGDLARKFGLSVDTKDVKVIEFVREPLHRRELWLIHFHLMPGYFGTFFDCGTTSSFIGVAKNEDLYKSLEEMAHYFGGNMKVREKPKE